MSSVLCKTPRERKIGFSWKMIKKIQCLVCGTNKASMQTLPCDHQVITNKRKTSHKIWKWFWCLRLYHKCLLFTNIHGKPYMARSWRISCRNLRWTFLVNNGWRPYLTTFKNWLSRDSFLTCALGGLSPVLCPHYPDGSSPGEKKKIWWTLKTIDIK